LRNRNKTNGENLGIRFGRAGEEKGFTGDAYSLVPHEFGNHAAGLALAKRYGDSDAMSDSKFRQSVGTAIDSGVNFQLKNANLGQRGETLSDSIHSLSQHINVTIADMGTKPATERYNGRGNTQSTPKFGTRPVPQENVRSTINLIGPNGIAKDSSELETKMKNAGLNLNAPVSDQLPKLRDFLASEISTKLDSRLK
jgi:hypothetical protein